ncbi:4Fe-4S dicluster domain-containing protein [Candidatus Falkowbacteria bacterium]|nr:4Fe-4S dicluster domain-containing protein [Candidatus Falkowbacteria bacterium]NCT54972.1 4Fe-4S dicluster domain-containing protein [Candidatus Falkowbacteria bacterium]
MAIKKLIAEPNSSLKNKTGPWRTHKPITDRNICISCGLCAKICPENCIEMKKVKSYDKLKPVTDYDYCKGCALCVKECPVKAIRMEEDF